MKNRQLMIVGAFGGVNIGDEVILDRVIKAARARGYGNDIDVVCTAPQRLSSPETKAQYSKWRARPLYLRNPFSILRHAMGKDVIIGGGQVIDGSGGWRLPVVQLAICAVASLSGGRAIFAGAGVFKIKSGIARRAYNLLFRLAKDVCVRDAASADMIDDAHRAKVRVTADVVFGHEFDSQRTPGGAVVLAVHHAPHVQFLEHGAAIDLLTHLRKTFGARVALAVHDKREKFDLEFAQQLSAKTFEADESIPATPLKIFTDVADCDDFYSKASLVISARMHPLILGAMHGCACVPLKGSSKVGEFARLVNVPLRAPQDVAQLDAETLDRSCPDPLKLAELQAIAQSNYDALVDGAPES